MNCSEIKPKLGFYLDQTLPDKEMLDIRNHVGTCMSCSVQFQKLEKIESVVQAGIYSEPPDEYWHDVPQRITERIGIRAEISTLEQFIESIQALFAAKSFRLGFTGALAVAVLVFFFSKSFIWDRESTTVTQAELMKKESVSTPFLADSNEDANTTSLGSENELVINEKKNLVAKEPVSEPVTLQRQNESSREIAVNYFSDELLALNIVESRPLKTESRVALGVNRELFPIPNTEFIRPPQIDDLEDTNNPLQRTFALDKQGARASQADAVSDLPDEIKEIRSGFLETLWIVQESQTLDEKKNIWVSYINRETDITYRSLAVYNLALVLAGITEKNKELDHAVAARSFFLEHEEALRFQMGDVRFDNKLSLFAKILAN